jgi:hypothetical protein
MSDSSALRACSDSRRAPSSFEFVKGNQAIYPVATQCLQAAVRQLLALLPDDQQADASKRSDRRYSREEGTWNDPTCRSTTGSSL